MPETSLHPPGQPKADVVVAEATLSEYQALRQAGCYSGLDLLFLILIGMSFITLIFWRIFASPSRANLIVVLLVVIALFQTWVVLLIFRCARFILYLRGAMELLPQEAARIVMAGYSGRTLSQRK